jgi:hypothetical protein
VPATTAVPVASRSPPVSAGEPPSTAEKSFGICQHSMRKIRDAPITSNASIAGEAEVATACALGIQSSEMFMPTPISRYSSMILTPFETPKPM